MTIRRVWRAKAGGTRLHLFVAGQLEDHALENLAAACNDWFAHGDIREGETSVFCVRCLLAAGSTVCLTEPATTRVAA